ncbi:hypothetical protein CU098_007796, partial [Rhizopus stolonifer]
MTPTMKKNVHLLNSQRQQKEIDLEIAYDVSPTASQQLTEVDDSSDQDPDDDTSPLPRRRLNKLKK